MKPSVKNFFQQTKKLINEFNFSEIFKLARAYFKFPSEMAEMWQMLKTVQAPLSYKNILPGYTTYEDLNDAYIESKDLDNLNSQFKIDLPNMTFHEILKVVRELYSASLDERRFLMLLGKDDIQCHQVELKISSSLYVQLSYIQEGNQINQVIPLEVISKRYLNWVPGLCIAYKNQGIDGQMEGNKIDILDTLDDIREGKI